MTSLSEDSSYEVVCCVVVCYRPDAACLLRLCETLSTRGARVVVVDNTEQPALDGEMLPPRCTLITLGANTGIAHAQNVGIAFAGPAEAIAFFDQDSQPPDELLETLLSRLQLGMPDIVAPVCVDEATGAELPSTRLNRRGGSAAVYCVGDREPVSVDIVISSGCVATREVFALVGGFDEGFFIDFVDTEWCLRCRTANVPIKVVPKAVMPHRIGAGTVKVARQDVSIHSSLRCYYQIRNSLLLIRRKHVPLLFSIEQFVSILVNRMLLLLLVKERLNYVKAYLCALRDGIRGYSGPKPA